MRGGGHIKYALIGLAPYSFHFDESKSFRSNFRLLQYAIMFHDMHNFNLSASQYCNIFKEQFLSNSLPTEELDVNNVFMAKSSRSMNLFDQINLLNLINDWKNKNYPATVEENVKILDDYLMLCEENNIRAIMFIPPLCHGFIKQFSQVRLDEFHYLVRSLQKKHSSVLFFDGWKLKTFVNSDFSDAVHLNLNGAAKFSAIFNSMIENFEKMS